MEDIREVLEIEFQRCKKLRRKIIFQDAKDCTFSKSLKRIERILTSNSDKVILEAIDELKNIKEDE